MYIHVWQLPCSHQGLTSAISFHNVSTYICSRYCGAGPDASASSSSRPSSLCTAAGHKPVCNPAFPAQFTLAASCPYYFKPLSNGRAVACISAWCLICACLGLQVLLQREQARLGGVTEGVLQAAILQPRLQ